MNERIKELRRQATLVETYTATDGSVHEGKHVDLEKFAELIVRECADFCVHSNSLLLAIRMKEHFGVEK